MSCTVILSGIAGRAPRQLENGALEVAVKTVTMKPEGDGIHKQVSEWHRVVFASRRLVDMAKVMIRPGARVYVVGRLVYKGENRQAFIVVGGDGHLTVETGSAHEESNHGGNESGTIGRVIVENSSGANAEQDASDVPF